MISYIWSPCTPMLTWEWEEDFKMEKYAVAFPNIEQKKARTHSTVGSCPVSQTQGFKFDFTYVTKRFFSE